MAQILAIQYLPSFFFISGYASIAINSALEPSEGIFVTLILKCLYKSILTLFF